MEYRKIKEVLEQYWSLYEEGLKKQANQVLVRMCETIEESTEEERSRILENLVEELCDQESSAFLMDRGNGELPYALKNTVRGYLRPLCEEEKMPQLRWFYQLFRYDRQDAAYAYSCLEKAYQCDPTDRKSIQLMLEFTMDQLAYALHELPQGLVYGKEETDALILQGESLLGAEPSSNEKAERFTQLKMKYLEFLKK